MSKKYRFAFIILILVIGACLGLTAFLQNHSVVVLDPQGIIASKERDLLFITTILMLIIVIPTLIMIFFFAWKYRAENTKNKYTPDWDANLLVELAWWAFPCIIIVALSVLTWESCHQLDPFRPLDIPNKKPLKVQVVALQWKWLFLYPEQGIASVNLLQFPEKTPLDFSITSDAPMNSFWIPQLGGQIYAMPGMSSKLYLFADKVGSFRGSSANLSGAGFAGMIFTALSCTEQDFEAWVQSVRQSSNPLNLEEYQKLVLPSENNPTRLYLLETKDLYDQIIMKYMGH